MSAARWQRLAADLEAAGTPVKVDERPYSELVCGRPSVGTTRSARLILADGRHVTIRDSWWRKNPDVWTGWQVSTETADGLVERDWPASKKRSAVVAAVLEAAAR